MKLVFISDTHDFDLTEMNIPDGDVLIHSGDATSTGTVKQFIDFNRQLGELPHKIKLFVPGNHDWLFQKDPDFAKNLLSNAITLIDKGYSLDEFTVYGSPWQPTFCNWAFNLDEDSELKQKWDNIPDYTDILITHCPPFGLLDGIMRYDNKTGFYEETHVGCRELFSRVMDLNQLKIHCFGHVHFSYGEYQGMKTHFINSSICNEQYQPVNKPIEVEL